MPGAIKTVKRRKLKSKAWYKKKYSVSEIATKALQGVNYVRQLINVEKKTHDAQVNSTFDYTGIVNCLTLVPGGSAEQQRNGNSILLKAVAIRGRVALDTIGVNNSIRIIVFQDLSPNPGSVTPANLIESTGTIYAPFSPMNTDNRSRFKILSSKLLTLTQSGNANAAFKFYLPVNTHCKWNSATSSDLNKGHIYTLIVSNTATSLPAVTYMSRVYYYDN